jgi:hypothetical protein
VNSGKKKKFRLDLLTDRDTVSSENRFADDIFTDHFNTAQVGMAIGLSTFAGTVVGELLAGPVSDRILYLQTRRSGGAFKPEARLQAMWPGFFLCPAGVIIEGVTLQYRTHWVSNDLPVLPNHHSQDESGKPRKKICGDDIDKSLVAILIIAI